MAVTIAQAVVTQLVETTITRRIAELLDRREFFAGQRAAPHGFDGGLMLGLVSEQVEHAEADPGTMPEDAFELVRGGAVDGKPPVLEVGHLNEGVRAFDDVGQDIALGERFQHTTLECLVQLSKPRFALSQCKFGENLLRRL
jgi:hypothetical protein